MKFNMTAAAILNFWYIGLFQMV